MEVVGVDDGVGKCGTLNSTEFGSKFTALRFDARFLKNALPGFKHIILQLPMIDRNVFTIWLAVALKHFSNIFDLDPAGHVVR
uniref:Uncharacterized protein n=1 Tax=Romanomermis culicivorax TaxID=13658 RepID=A0A915HL22_ROMCU